MKMESKEKLIEILKSRNDVDFVDNHSMWECEENMHADHFAIHSRPGIRANPIPLMPISMKEIIEIQDSILA